MDRGGMLGSESPQPEVVYLGHVRVAWIGEAWSHMMRNAGVWIPAGIIYLAVLFGIGVAGQLAVMKTLGRSEIATSILPLAGTILVGSYLSCGMYRMANRSLRRQPVSLADLFMGARNWPRMMALVAISEAPGTLTANAAAYLFIGHLVGSGPAFGFESLLVGFFFGSLVSLAVQVFTSPAASLVGDGVSLGQSLRRSIRGLGPVYAASLSVAGVFWLLSGLWLLTCYLSIIFTAPLMVITSSIAARERLGLPVNQTPEWPVEETNQPGVWPPPPRMQ